MPERNEPETPSLHPAEPLPPDTESDGSGSLAGEANDPAPSPRKGTHHRHRHRTDHRHRVRHQRSPRTLWIFLLSILLVSETVVLIVLFSWLSMQEKEWGERQLAIEAGAREQKVLRSELKTLEKDMDQRVRARLPRLRPVRMDSIIAIDEAPVSNIVFTTSGKDRSVSCEYKVLMSNPGPSPIQVRLDFLFFNRAGIQIGRSPIGVSRNGASASITLEPGETRSYSATADLDPEERIPAYFMLAERAP